MKSLEAILAQQTQLTLTSLANYIRAYIADEWQSILEAEQNELTTLFDRAGEGAAYGTYAKRLLQPVQTQLKQNSIQTSPNFPGTLATSREWGPMDMRERWMWSIFHKQEDFLGMIAIGLFHDHTEFRVPKSPAVLEIDETKEAAIVKALSQIADDLINQNQDA